MNDDFHKPSHFDYALYELLIVCFNKYRSVYFNNSIEKIPKPFIRILACDAFFKPGWYTSVSGI